MPILGTSDVHVRAKTGKFNKDIDQAEHKFKRFDKNVDAVANRIAKNILGIAIASAAVSTAIIKVGLDFEMQMATVGAVSRASAEDFERLRQAARDAGAMTDWSATQSAEALKYMAMAGFTAQQAIDALPDVLNLATAGQLDLARASDIATDTLTAMGLKVSDLSRLNDVFIGTITRTNTDVNMLGESFKYVAPIAGQLNYSLEETSAMLGVLANAGIKASDAGTDLRQAMLRVNNAVKALGMKEGSTLIDVLKEIEKRQLSVNKVQEMFGLIATKSVLVLKKNIDAYEALHGTLKKNHGETEKVAKAMRDTLGGALKTLRSSIEEDMLKLFDIFKDDLQDIVENLTELSRSFGDWIEKNEDLINSKVSEYLTDIKDVVKELWQFVQAHPDMIKYGLMGMIIGPKSAILIGGFAHMIKVIQNIGTAIDMVKKGTLEFSEFATSNFEELDKLIKERTSLSKIDQEIANYKAIIAKLEKEVKSAEKYQLSSFGGDPEGFEKLKAELGKYKGLLLSAQAFKDKIEKDAQEKALKDEQKRLQKLEEQNLYKREIELSIKDADKFKEDLQNLFKVEIGASISEANFQKKYPESDLKNEMGDTISDANQIKSEQDYYKKLLDRDKADANEMKKQAEAKNSFYNSVMDFEYAVDIYLSSLEQIVQMPSAILDSYASLFNSIGDFPEQFRESVLNLKESIPYMVDGVVDTIENLLPELPDMITEVIDEMVAEVPRITQAFIDNIPKIVQAFVENAPNLAASGIASSLTMATGGLFDFGKLFGKENKDFSREAKKMLESLESAASSAESLIDDIKQWQRDVAYEKSDDKVGFLKDELSGLAEDIAKETDAEKRIELMEKQWETTKDLYDVAKEQLENLQQSSDTVQAALDSLTLSGNTTSLAGAELRYDELFAAAKSGDSNDVSAFVDYQEQYRDFLEAAGVSTELLKQRSISDLETLQDIIEEKQSEYQSLQDAIEENTASSNLNTVGLDAVVAELQSINNSISNLDIGSSSGSGFLSDLIGIAINPVGSLLSGLGGLFAEGGYADTPSIFGEAGPEWAIPAYSNPNNQSFLKSVGMDQVVGAIEKGMNQQRGKSGDTYITVVTELDGKVIARKVVKVAQSDAQTRVGLKKAVGS